MTKLQIVPIGSGCGEGNGFLTLNWQGFMLQTDNGFSPEPILVDWIVTLSLSMP
jgi:hypothetical protein